jgi:hypothetical protein
MGMDKFEERIRKIRGDLDQYNPSPEIWSRIEKGLKKRKSLKWQWISIAAMVVIILGTAVVLLKPSFLKDNLNYGLKTDEETNPSLRETEFYYNSLVNSLYHKATPLLTTNPEIEKELSDDLSRLDSICADIKKDLRDNVANQEVVEALIQNYRIKIRLLEDILDMLKENEENPGKTNKYDL